MMTENQSISNGTPQTPALHAESFVDRRDPGMQRKSPGLERRQFSDGREGLSPAAAELGAAIDQYKLEHCRRFISYEEMLNVIHALGYSKSN